MVKVQLSLAIFFAFFAYSTLADPTCSNCIFLYKNTTTLSLPIYCVPKTGGPASQCGTVTAIEDSNQVLHFKVSAASSYCFEGAAFWLSANSPNITGNLRTPIDQWPFFVSGGGQCKNELDFSVPIADIDDGETLCDQQIWFALAVIGWKDKYSTEPGCHPVEYTGCAKGDFQFSDSVLEDCGAANCWFTKFLLCKEYCEPCPIATEFPGISDVIGIDFTIDVPLVISENFLREFPDINCAGDPPRTFNYTGWDYVAKFFINGTNLPAGAEECWAKPGTILLSNCAYNYPNAVVYSLVPAGTDPDDICSPPEATQCGSNFEPCPPPSFTFELSRFVSGQSFIIYFFTNEFDSASKLDLYCLATGSTGRFTGSIIGDEFLSLNN